MIVDIIKEQNKILGEVCEDVAEDQFGSDLQNVLSNMAETMYFNKGVGLAAPQIGILKRMLVMDSGPDYGNNLIKMVNPMIVWRSDNITSLTEQCLSVPNFELEVKRPSSTLVRFRGYDGASYEVELTGLNSHIVQHEIDHLDGITILGSSSKIKKSFYLKKLKKDQ